MRRRSHHPDAAGGSGLPVAPNRPALAPARKVPGCIVLRSGSAAIACHARRTPPRMDLLGDFQLKPKPALFVYQYEPNHRRNRQPAGGPDLVVSPNPRVPSLSFLRSTFAGRSQRVASRPPACPAKNGVTFCICAPLSIVILIYRRESKDPEGDGSLQPPKPFSTSAARRPDLRGSKWTLDRRLFKHSRGPWSLRYAVRYLCQAEGTTPCGRSG